MFFEIGVLKNFAIFPGKHLCWSFFLIKLNRRLVILQSYIHVNEVIFESNTGVFLLVFLRAAFSIKHVWWLLLYVYHLRKNLGREWFRKQMTFELSDIVVAHNVRIGLNRTVIVLLSHFHTDEVIFDNLNLCLIFHHYWVKPC